MNVVIVGPGRLGRTMAAVLTAGGHGVELVGRGARVPNGPLTWLTVPDREIGAAAAQVPPGGVLLHASGATDLAPLRPRRPVGSLHPLMSFPGPEIAVPDLAGVPAAIAGDPAALVAARELAEALGMTPMDVPGDRALYHAAAVLAGNFATVLLAEAAQVLIAAGVDPALAERALVPLASTSVHNVGLHGAKTALTGPLARGDSAVIARHRRALGIHAPDQAETYEALLRAAQRLVQRPPEPGDG